MRFQDHTTCSSRARSGNQECLTPQADMELYSFSCSHRRSYCSIQEKIWGKGRETGSIVSLPFKADYKEDSDFHLQLFFLVLLTGNESWPRVEIFTLCGKKKFTAYESLHSLAQN